MALTTAVTEALKEHYKPQRIKEMVYKNNPLLALIPKYTKFGGENMPMPIITTGPQRRSATFATGQANTSTSSLKQFLLTRVSDYSFASIAHEAIKASQGNADAFIRYATMEIDGAIHSLKRSLAVGLYRDGSGSIGQTEDNPNGVFADMTLINEEDVSNFEVGMEIAFYAPDGTGGGPGTARSATRVISAIDRSATLKSLTFSVAPPVDVAYQDHLVQAGDLDAKISGLEAWCPASAPAATAFFGVDRTTDTSRLGGNRSDGSAKPIEEALIDGLSLAARNGGAPSHIFVDYATYANIEKALGSKVQYDKLKASDANVGFTSLKIHGPAGTVDVIPDVNCQPDVAWALQLDTWSLNSLGEAPQILDLDGNNMLREASADAYEVRMGFYGNCATVAPGWNCRIALA